MYQALYRKWRPRVFDDVVGQQQVTETLKNQIISGRTSHAYLFIGTRGTGKTTCAKILARALNCENPENGNPCNKCRSCLGIESGTVMDVVEIDAASNNGVENVRALRDEAVYSPASVKKRVYIIDEVHMLSTSAFNALLKILEEPPEHLVFILATTEIHKVLPTILSRCQRYSFRRISTEDIAGRLRYVAQQESIRLEADAADLLARLADGALRDGLSLLDQCSGGDHVTSESVLTNLGLAGNFRIAQLLEHVTRSSTPEAIGLFETLWQEGKAPGTLLSELCTLLRDITMLKVAPKGGAELLSGGFDPKTLESFCKTLSVGEAMSYIEMLQTGIGKLRDGRDPKIEAELCIIGLCEPRLLETPERLALRISKLENALQNGGIPDSVVVPAPPKSVPAKSAPTVDETQGDDEPPFDMEGEISDSDSIVSKPEIIDENIPDIVEPQRETTAPPADKNSVGPEFWTALFEELKSSMPAFHFAHLAEAAAEMRGDTLIIMVAGSFKKLKLEGSEPQELIRRAIDKVLGKTIPFKIEEAKLPPAANGKLDELSKFGNVKFK